MITITLVISYIWCANTLVYFGLNLSTGSLAGNVYINFALSGLTEIPAGLLAPFVLNRFGRRTSFVAFQTLAGVSLLGTLLIPKTTANGISLQPLIMTLAMVGKFGITGSFGALFLYTPELFPTTLRNVGTGIASVGGRIGNLMAPVSPLVAREVWWLPNLVYSVTAIVAAGLTLLLPETMGRPLPVTIEDVEGWTRSISKEERKMYKEKQKALHQMLDRRNDDTIDKVDMQLLQKDSNVKVFPE